VYDTTHKPVCLSQHPKIEMFDSVSTETKSDDVGKVT